MIAIKWCKEGNREQRVMRELVERAHGVLLPPHEKVQGWGNEPR